ncbi:MAG: hypothetical protein QOK19_389, partial [Solirubrobacteraceae bacterium]|nr:hypothetical protein [Solirubrobacteraceae bacterium]
EQTPGEGLALTEEIRYQRARSLG